MKTYQFEEMQTEHLAAVLAIYEYYVVNTTATFHTHIPSPAEMRQIVFFDDDKYQAFAILDGTILCGYVILTQHKKREAYAATGEVTIYLKPGYERQGIGNQAIAFIEEAARKKAFHVLVATICGENTASISLFAKNGYNQCAHYREVGKKFGRWLDLVAYQKII